ncbi:MAG: bifunctional demethylmenaquinone methyltransferase/2-methoxy-6-polyprenyl-1,4-benzoquinol methylase UbiE [bacterium]
MAPQKESVRYMFDEISSRYDFLNHFLSFGIDRRWRMRVRNELARKFGTRLSTLSILDMATGTGDLAIEVSKGNSAEIFGLDISLEMMAIARKKVAVRGLSERITFGEGEAEKIPFGENRFDAVLVAFGVRNFEDLNRGLAEMKRVLKPDGLLLILEFSQPRKFPMALLYRAYSKGIIPFLGKLISRHREAYSYLPETAAAFPSGEDFLRILQTNGFRQLRQISLSGGIASLYCAEK